MRRLLETQEAITRLLTRTHPGQNLSGKIEKPTKFNGKYPEIETWLFSMDQYFEASGIHRNRTQLAATYLDGQAATWWRLLVTNGVAPVRWVNFREAILRQFKSPNAVFNARNRLAKLTQTGRVSDYNSAFNNVIMGIPDLSASELLDRYVRGLKDKTRVEVILKAPQNLLDAQNIADKIDTILFGNDSNRDRRTWQAGKPQRPQGSTTNNNRHNRTYQTNQPVKLEAQARRKAEPSPRK